MADQEWQWRGIPLTVLIIFGCFLAFILFVVFVL